MDFREAAEERWREVGEGFVGGEAEGGRGGELQELAVHGWQEGDEEGEGEEMRVEEVFFPVRAVFFVRFFRVEAHDGGEDLGYEEDGEAFAEGGQTLGGFDAFLIFVLVEFEATLEKDVLLIAGLTMLR